MMWSSHDWFCRVYNDDQQWFRSIFANSTKDDAIQNQYEFFIQRMGGPPLYAHRKGTYSPINHLFLSFVCGSFIVDSSWNTLVWAVCLKVIQIDLSWNLRITTQRAIYVTAWILHGREHGADCKTRTLPHNRESCSPVVVSYENSSWQVPWNRLRLQDPDVQLLQVSAKPQSVTHFPQLS